MRLPFGLTRRKLNSKYVIRVMVALTIVLFRLNSCTLKSAVYIYRILHVFSFNINIDEKSLRNVINQAFGELYNVSGRVS